MPATALQDADDSTFAAHCRHIGTAVSMIERADHAAALAELDAALKLAESPHARWNRALTLLALGRFDEGLRDYDVRWQLFGGSPTSPELFQIANDLPRWHGEVLFGRRLVLIHEAGFGDTIMVLRYVRRLQADGIDVALAMPPQLRRLASGLAPTVARRDLTERDVGCFTFDLFRHVALLPLPPAPYLMPDPELQWMWHERLAGERRRKVGIAWSTINRHGAHRKLPLTDFLELLEEGLDEERNNYALFSLQTNESDLARSHGVEAFAFKDFADLAAFIAELDRVITIDTAALHVAGAVGHANAAAVLPHGWCWRWACGAPWYPQMRLCRQAVPGDWGSAFAMIQ